MKAQGGGAIVNTASINGLVGSPQAGYVTSKHAVVGITRSAALAFARDNIRVNAVCPGLVNTPLAADLMADAAFVAATRARIPLGRIMEPEDIAGPAVFLLSAAASGITGIALPVDGGVTAE
jgi:NAD(P)-dependent dehydrogenase (short-subunit alcohol dehydrogenase family)